MSRSVHHPDDCPSAVAARVPGWTYLSHRAVLLGAVAPGGGMATIAFVSGQPAPPVAVALKAADGDRVAARFYTAPAATAVILLFHQAGASEDEYAMIAPRFAALGYDVLTIDQRLGGSLFGVKETVCTLGHSTDYFAAREGIVGGAVASWPAVEQSLASIDLPMHRAALIRTKEFLMTCIASKYSASALLAAGLLAACGQSGGESQALAAAPGPQVAGASPTHPVVVELFQSQGCSSCPPANANVNAIASRPDVLALSFAVTYWDQLGWKDSFASPRNTARQWEYARHAGRPQVATPQVIVNGSTAIVGSNRQQLNETITAAGPARGGPTLDITGRTVHLSAAQAAKKSTVWLVRYDPRSVEVAIRAGENGGRTLPHRNIVRDLVKLGDWTGPAATLSIPGPVAPGLSSAILVQQGIGGKIIAARKI